MSREQQSYKWEIKGLNTGDAEEHRVGQNFQQVRWSREIFKPFKLPRAVTAMDSVLKNS